eukprot:646314-Amphidinium_carterae.1
MQQYRTIWIRYCSGATCTTHSSDSQKDNHSFLINKQHDRRSRQGCCNGRKMQDKTQLPCADCHSSEMCGTMQDSLWTTLLQQLQTDLTDRFDGGARYAAF